MFQHSPSELQHLAADAVQLARKLGASAAEADIGESLGQSVQVRLQEIENIEYRQDKSLDVTVYHGHSKGCASTADFSAQALRDTVQAALAIARHTAQDPCAGLADADLMADRFGDLDVFHVWQPAPDEAAELAKQCEAAALAADPRIKNSEGAAVQSGQGQAVYANSHGFNRHRQSTRHSISCSVVAADDKGMERDYWYDFSCDAKDLSDPAAIGRTAAARAAARLGAGGADTGTYAVAFDRTVAGSLLGHLAAALGGGALYRGNSFLNNSIGKKILPDFFHLREEPHLPRMPGSAWYDAEGVATRPRFVIENGVVRGYFLGSYSARRLGMNSTGNAGGAHNLLVGATCADQAALLAQMGRGLLVTELMGQGANILTGDYSRGAAGFWVEDGRIVRPVSGITIAGRLPEMLAGIAAVADDALPRRSLQCGSLLVGEMTVAGN